MPNRQEVIDIVLAAVADTVGISVEELNLTDTLEQIDVDSLDIVELVMDLENDLGIEIQDEDVSNNATIERLVNVVIQELIANDDFVAEEDEVEEA